MQQKALAYARQVLAAQDTNEDARPGQAFRTRISHIERVCMWVERLLSQGGIPDATALRLAAAFHDIGYVRSREGHGRHSADMLMDYAKIEGIAPDVAERAAFLVGAHSDKEKWLVDPDAPRDLVLLMEADLLDEEGAMGLVLDCMTEGALGQGYEAAWMRMQQYEPRRLAYNPMVTPLAQSIWTEKQRLIGDFMRAFATDLGVNDEA